MASQKTPAKKMQEITEAPPEAERRIRVCLRTDVGYEHHLVMAESAVNALIDPDVPDLFMEVPRPVDIPTLKHRYMHTSRIKEIDTFDEFTAEEDGEDVPVKRVG